MNLSQVNLVQMSLMGAILIVSIIILRAVTINRLPKRTFLVMWDIAGLSLCIPFHISLDFLAGIVRIKSMEAVRENVSYTMQNFSQGMQSTTYQTSDMVTESAGKSIPVLFMIWIAGLSVCLLFFTVSYVRSMRRFAASFPVRNEYTEQWMKNHKLQRTIEIRESGMVNTPLTYGLLYPVILVPKRMNWNDEEQVSYILEHEFIHIRRMDIVMKSILIILVSIHWFNPLVWAMYLLCNRDLELSCDEMVIRNFGIEKRSEYAYVLIHMEESKSSFMPLCNYFSKNAIEERIMAIMKTKKISKGKIISASVLVAGVSILSVLSMSASANTKHDGTALEIPTAWEGTEYEGQSDAAWLAGSSQFPEYEKYGLSYDEKSGYLMYDSQTVGYFKDEFQQNKFCRFVEDTGEIGVEVMRDGDWNMTGMAVFPMSDVMNGDAIEISNSNSVESASTGEENIATTISESEAQSTYAEAAEASGDGLTTPNEGYFKAGIEWKNNTWYYNGKLVSAIYDHNGGIYTTDSTSSAGITYLEISRDKKGKLDQVTEITEEQMQILFHNNMSE